ncbi:MAG TPA: lytic transglycosylase domain-containing protein [Thermoanaerobaculia bacterium]|nr:lytic transglycosylase domain-containing protein [Thermoanaerobaculia bacterium]
MTKFAVAVVGLLAIAVTARADVRLAVRPDGKKVIYNVWSPSVRTSNYTWLAKQRNRRSAYDKMIERYADAYNVDPVLVHAVILVESDFNPRCVSNKNARGLMQLIPETAQRYGVKNVFDPEENIRGGVHYLSDLLEMFGHDMERALAAYNAGEGAVTRYGGIPPYQETSTYVNRALTVYYGRPYGTAATATWYPGHSGGAKLHGGFGAMLQPIVIPGLRILGAH